MLIENQAINIWLVIFAAGACMITVLAFIGFLAALWFQQRRLSSPKAEANLSTKVGPQPEPGRMSDQAGGSRWLVLARGAGAPVMLKLSPNGVTLGRSAQNQLVLLDSEISRFHARVLKKGDTWVIVDLNSRNGTYVNDSQVTIQDLSLGDRIRLGKGTELVFQA